MNTSTPQPERSLSDDDVQTCVRVLRAIEADRSHLTRLTQDQRRELLTLAGLIAKPERHDLVKMAKAFRRAEREARKEQDRRAIEQAGLRVQRRAEVYSPLWLEPPKPEDLGERPELNKERACYVCKKPFVKVHRYYDSMCEECGDFNYAKREQTADLNGRYALVTGARVKIGFQASLKLLRAGAHAEALATLRQDAAGLRTYWNRLSDVDRLNPKVARAGAESFLVLGGDREAAEWGARGVLAGAGPQAGGEWTERPAVL
jgi:hypothetical protein